MHRITTALGFLLEPRVVLSKKVAQTKLKKNYDVITQSSLKWAPKEDFEITVDECSTAMKFEIGAS